VFVSPKMKFMPGVERTLRSLYKTLCRIGVSSVFQIPTLGFLPRQDGGGHRLTGTLASGPTVLVRDIPR